MALFLKVHPTLRLQMVRPILISLHHKLTYEGLSAQVYVHSA